MRVRLSNLSHNMTQIAINVAAVLIGLWSLIAMLIAREGKAFICKAQMPMQKCRGLMFDGVIFVGHLHVDTCIICICISCKVNLSLARVTNFHIAEPQECS